MTSQLSEIVPKVLLGTLTVIILPTFGWVWSAESRVAALENELSHTQREVSEMRANSTDIRLIQKDIQHINVKLGEIAKLIEGRERP